MRKELGLVFCFFTLVLSAQKGIVFEKGSFSALLEKAGKEDKLVFVDAYAVWCGPCKLMEKNIFPLQSVGAYYNKHFVNVHMDMEKGEGKEIAKRYGVSTFPHYLFLTPEGEVVLRGYGYLDEKNFLLLAQEANNKKNGASQKDRFLAGERSPEFLLETSKVYLQSDPEFSRTVAETYFELKNSSPYTHEEIALLLRFIESEKDPNFSVLKRDKEEITKLLPKDIYDSYKERIELNTVARKSMLEKEGLINEVLFLQEAAKIVGEERAKTELLRFKVNYFPAVENFQDYEQAALLYFEDGKGHESTELERATYLFVQHVSSPESLGKAAQWMKESRDRGETIENTYVSALLYQKLQEKELALDYAQKSFQLMKNKSSDASLAQELIETLSKEQ